MPVGEPHLNVLSRRPTAVREDARASPGSHRVVATQIEHVLRALVEAEAIDKARQFTGDLRRLCERSLNQRGESSSLGLLPDQFFGVYVGEEKPTALEATKHVQPLVEVGRQ